jgi:hypothetical protein
MNNEMEISMTMINRKIGIIITITLLPLLLFAMPTFASSITTNNEQNIRNTYDLRIDNVEVAIDYYHMFAREYEKLTGVSQKDALKLCDELNQNGLIKSDLLYLESILPSIMKSDLDKSLELILYIQDNYTDLTLRLNADQKKTFDKFLLYHSLKYYRETTSGKIYINNIFRIMDDISNLKITEPEAITVKGKPSIEIIHDDVLTPTIFTATANDPIVAELRIFSDPTASLVGSSGLSMDVGTHSWITVKNISGSNITVGPWSIASGKTIVIGTWGNKSEHTGLWYSLEPYFISISSAYSGRVSLTCQITANGLYQLSTKILFTDFWSPVKNCSTFAAECWNIFHAGTSKEIFLGIVATPKVLASIIKSYSGYSTNAAVPYDYAVYYANGAGTPKKSTVY